MKTECASLFLMRQTLHSSKVHEKMAGTRLPSMPRGASEPWRTAPSLAAASVGGVLDALPAAPARQRASHWGERRGEAGWAALLTLT